MPDTVWVVVPDGMITAAFDDTTCGVDTMWVPECTVLLGLLRFFWLFERLANACPAKVASFCAANPGWATKTFWRAGRVVNPPPDDDEAAPLFCDIQYHTAAANTPIPMSHQTHAFECFFLVS